MTSKGIPTRANGRASKRKGLSTVVGLVLCSTLSMESSASSQGLVNTSHPPAEPSGTLLLPLTPKLDDGASPAFDKTPPKDDSTADESAGGPHQIRATSTLKPAPEAITPEVGQVTDDVDDTEGDTKLYKGTVQIIADDTEYDQDNNTFLGTGNAVAIIGGQDSKLEADTIFYNQTDGIMDCRGNVRVFRNGQVTTGSAFKFKISSDEYLVTAPDTEISGSQIVARTGYGARGGITFKSGTLQEQKPFFMSKNASNGPLSYKEAVSEEMTHPDAFVPPTPSYTFKARKIVYEKYKDDGNLTVYGGKIMFGNFGVPVPKMVMTLSKETKVMFPTFAYLGNNLQTGGTQFGPTFSTGIGKTGVLMWAPLLQMGGANANPANLNTTTKGSSLGLAAQAGFSNYFMSSHLGYGSVSNMVAGDFKVRLRKQFRFQSGINRYLDDGMFGTRRARLLAELVDNHAFTKIPLIANLNFRTSGGWAQDNPQLVQTTSAAYAKLFGTAANSTKMNAAFKVQEQITASTHPLFALGDSRFGLKSYFYGGLAARGYSTGQANTIAQAGPVFDAYFGRIRLQTGYTQSVYQGSSPFVYDEFVQGTRSVFLNGDVRLSKWLCVGGSLGYNLVQKTMYSEMVTAAFGPDDFKVLLSRNIVQGTNKVGFNILYGQPIPYDKLVLKGTADQGQLGGI